MMASPWRNWHITVQLEKHWFRGPALVILWLHSTSPPIPTPTTRCRQPERTRGCSHLELRPSRGRALSTWTLASLFPAPLQASFPVPMSQPNRWSRYSCLWVGKGWPKLELEGWGCSCVSSRFLRAQRGSEPEVGRAGGGLGAGVGPSLCCPAF